MKLFVSLIFLFGIEQVVADSLLDSMHTNTECDIERERTFIMIKPDGVQRGLIGEIIQRFERKGLKLVALKLLQANEALLSEHYAEHLERPFFNDLVRFVGSGPVCAMIWEGLDAVKIGRSMIGETDPANSPPGTIRGDFGIAIGRNVIHGSNSVESAKREINLWFTSEEIIKWHPSDDRWIHEENLLISKL